MGNKHILLFTLLVLSVSFASGILKYVIFKIIKQQKLSLD